MPSPPSQLQTQPQEHVHTLFTPDSHKPGFKWKQVHFHNLYLTYPSTWKCFKEENKLKTKSMCESDSSPQISKN